MPWIGDTKQDILNTSIPGVYDQHSFSLYQVEVNSNFTNVTALNSWVRYVWYGTNKCKLRLKCLRVDFGDVRIGDDLKCKIVDVFTTDILRELYLVGCSDLSELFQGTNIDVAYPKLTHLGWQSHCISYEDYLIRFVIEQHSWVNPQLEPGCIGFLWFSKSIKYKKSCHSLTTFKYKIEKRRRKGKAVIKFKKCYIELELGIMLALYEGFNIEM